MIPPADAELLQDFLTGTLADTDVRLVEFRLKNEPLLAEALVLLAREEALLTEWARSMAAVDSADAARYDAISDKTSPQRLPRVKVWVRAFVAAASLLALLGAGLSLLPTRAPAVALYAWLEEVQGEVFVGTLTARSHHPLQLGDEVRTSGELSFAVLRYPDGTRLTLGSDSVLRLEQAEQGVQGKRLFLSEGYVHADVAHQPAEQPMILATRQAQVRVVGTRFSSSAGDQGTRIELEEGRIQVSSAGKSLDVQKVGSVVDVAEPVRPMEKPEEIQPRFLSWQPLPPPLTTPRLTLPRGEGPIQGLKFAPLNALLAVGGWKGTVQVWDADAGVLLRSWDTQLKRTRCLDWSNDGSLIATGGDDKTAKIWDAHTGQLLWTLPEAPRGPGKPPRFNRDIDAVAFSPDSSVLAVAAEIRRSEPPVAGDITLWNPRTGAMTGRLAGHKDSILCVAFTPDGKQLVSGSRDGTLRVWDLETQTEVAALACGEPVLTLACSPDGKTLATGGRERSIRLWDVPTRQLRIALQGHPREVRSLAFTPDGKRLASSGRDPSIRVWDVESGKPVAHYQGHSFAVTSVAFSPDGRTLATAGWDKLVKLWDVRE